MQLVFYCSKWHPYKTFTRQVWQWYAMHNTHVDKNAGTEAECLDIWYTTASKTISFQLLHRSFLNKPQPHSGDNFKIKHLCKAFT